MNILAAAAVAAALLSMSAASAADLGAPRPVAPAYAPAPSAVADWRGFYVGGHAGGVWASADSTASVAGVPVATGSSRTSGLTGGGYAGYNWQSGAFVAGLEADFGTAKGMPWAANLRGRAGVAFDRWLPYVAGGATWAKVDFEAPGLATWSESRSGWTIGGGIEYVFDARWRARAEYRYVDLGRGGTNVLGAQIDTDLRAHTALAGLSYRF